MNRDEMIARAISVLDTAGIVKKDKNPEKLYIEKAFRGQISSLGAAVEMGSLLSAVAFFSSQGSSPTDRTKLMEAIYLLLTGNEKKDIKENETLLRYVAQNPNNQQLKREVIDAAVAIKLAMNAYELRDVKKGGDEGEKQES
mgnify:FL=1